VLAQNRLDGLDLEAIDKGARATAQGLGDFVTSVLTRQSKATPDETGDLSRLVDGAHNRLQEAASVARAKAGLDADGAKAGDRNALDLDGLVSQAGATMAPSPQTAPMFIAFASLSIPEASLHRMVADVSKAGGIVVFRGFSSNGPKPFMEALHKLVGQQGAAHISIDPRLFRAYGIETVPTYVAGSSSFELCSGEACSSTPTPYDRLAGNVTTRFALETIAQARGPGAPVAALALKNLEHQP